MYDFLKSKDEISFNAKVKYYPNGKQNITVFNKPVYLAKGYELANDRKCDSNRPDKYNTEGESRSDNLTRTKQKIYDIMLLNEDKFQYFVTLTFRSDDFIDRYDVNSIKKPLFKFLNNQVNRKGLFYELIPEHHKDGAIHLHGFISADELKLFDSGKRTNDGKVIYNWSDWKFGFLTAIPITSDKSFVAKYITKYVTKECKKIFGQYYLAGGKGLVREPPFELCNVDYDTFDCREYTIPDIYLKCKYSDKFSV